MTATNKLVREYNTLAMSLPDKVWTPRFAHPRMELVGTKVMMEYNIKHDHKYVPQRKPVLVEDIPEEIQRLKRRAAERSK